MANGDRSEVTLRAQRTLAICEQHGLFLTPYAAIYLSWVGNDAAQIAHILQMLLMGGARLGATHVYGMLAEVQLNNGDHEAALASLDAAEALMDFTGERYWDAELMRIRGEVLAATKRHDEAKAALELAVARANARGTPPLERRALQRLEALSREMASRT